MADDTTTPPSDGYAPIIPGILEVPSLNMLAGASGLGKTALIASVVAHVLRGGTLFGQPCTPPPAIGYIAADRPVASARQWFDLAGIGDLPTFSIIDDRKFDLVQLRKGPAGPRLLRHCIEQLNLPPGSWILSDPIALFLGGRLNDYTTVALAAIEIQRDLIEMQVATTGVCHTSKLLADVEQRYARPQDRILGSTALLGYSSTQMYLMGPDEAGRDDGQYTFSWTPHHRPAADFLIKRLPNGLFDVAGAYEQMPPLPAAAGIEGHLGAILSLFPEPPGTITPFQLLDAARTKLDGEAPSRATLFRCLTRLQEEGRISRAGYGQWARQATIQPVHNDAAPENL